MTILPRGSGKKTGKIMRKALVFFGIKRKIEFMLILLEISKKMVQQSAAYCGFLYSFLRKIQV